MTRLRRVIRLLAALLIPEVKCTLCGSHSIETVWMDPVGGVSGICARCAGSRT